MEKEKQPPAQTLKLQRSIRGYASNYLADNMFTLPALPSAEKYEEMLKRKSLERQRMKEKTASLKSKQNLLRSNNNSPVPFAKETPDSADGPVGNGSVNANQNESSSQGGFFRTSTSMFKAFKKDSRPVFQAISISKKNDTSWEPMQVNSASSENPIVQQMENVKGYIQQAKKDNKIDEVKMFEQNLQELELIYLEEQQSKAL